MRRDPSSREAGGGLDTPLRILMLEDNANDADLLEREFHREQLRYSIDRAPTREAFVKALGGPAPDVVLVDYQIPGFDGLSAIRMFQERGMTAPIIVVTGSISEETAVECMKAGAADYVLKDRLRRLVPAIRTAIERQRQRDERRRARDALRQSEARYRALVDHAPLGIFRITVDGRFTSVNAALVEMLGFDSANELLDVDGIRDLYVDASQGVHLLATSQDGRIEGHDVTWRRKDKQPITVRLSGRVLTDPRGPVVGVELICENVTEQRKLEAQLRQAQKMEAVGQLTGGIAHDFNNLLTVVLASVDFVLRSLPEDQQHLCESLLDAQTAGVRGSELVRKLLGFGRREPLAHRPIDLAQLISDLTAMLRRVVPESIEMHVRIPKGLDAIHADPGAVEQILMNLVTNARDAMVGGGTLVIEAAPARLDADYHGTHPWVKPGQYICVAVSDTGVGMDEATRERVFEPFFTTKAPETGTGLGLSMVYGLVKQHRGFVHVYSEPGTGTSIKVYLPITTDSPRPVSVPKVWNRTSGGTEQVLVVEDEPAIRSATRRALESAGYQVMLAANGEEGLEVLRERAQEIDLVICDLVMPYLGGRQFYEAMRRHHPDTRILFSSGYAPLEVHESIVLESGLPFLRKPWNVADLLGRVREILDGPAQHEAKG